MSYHVSVLLQEIIEYLHVAWGEQYIDATLGGGGHSLEIVRRGGKVLGIDADDDAVSYVRQCIKDRGITEEALKVVKGNFRDIDHIAHANIFNTVSGILFDLGVSSHQLETTERGFSFKNEGLLDMRMDQSLPVKAIDLINGLTEGELYELFHKLGEERFAHAISHGITSARRVKPIETTSVLAEIVRGSVRTHQDIHPATRVFQALRIAVNDELHALEEALPKAVVLLKPKGRLAVISFHSLEDRIVKKSFRIFEEKKMGKIITKKPIVPGSAEVQENSRSKSAKLRVFEKSLD